jgi:hypothetical protein
MAAAAWRAALVSGIALCQSRREQVRERRMNRVLACTCFSGLVTLATLAGCATQPDDETQESQVASPLKTTDHQNITAICCAGAGFGSAFCDRLAAEAHNVDAWEWFTLAAHAMPEANQSQCDAAAAVQERLRQRGSDIRALLAQPVITTTYANQLASALGRALHAVQDNCAHEGMTNPQHSWYSNRGYCLSDGEDPDTAPAAIQCAWTETVTALTYFADAVRASHHQLGDLVPEGGFPIVDPVRDQICSFLHEWTNFDGVDRRWNNGVMTPALRNTLIWAFSAGYRGPNACDNLLAVPGSSPLAILTPRAWVPVSDPMCFTEKVYCIGE